MSRGHNCRPTRNHWNSGWIKVKVMVIGEGEATHRQRKQHSPFLKIFPHALPGIGFLSFPAPPKPCRCCNSCRGVCSGRLAFGFGTKWLACVPQNASYNSVMISVRVRGVNSYLREPGIVSRANLRRDNGSDDRSRLLILSSLEGRNDEKVDIAANYL